MKNFIFKSESKSDLYKILTMLELLLAEQRHQRNDLFELKKLVKIAKAMREQPTADELGYTEDSSE